MIKMLRNLKINTALSSVLGLFAAMVVLVAVLGFITSSVVNTSLTLIQQINVQQLNSINRADSQLNAAQVNLAAAQDYLRGDRQAQGERRLLAAEIQLEEAEAFFQLFVDAPKTEQGQVLAADMEGDFVDVLEMVKEQLDALRINDFDDYNALSEMLIPAADALAESMANFVQYAAQRIQERLAHQDRVENIIIAVEVGVFILVALLLALVYAGMRKVVVEPLQLAATNLNSIAKADLSRTIPEMGKNEIGTLFKSMNAMQRSLTRIVGGVREASDSIHVGATEIASGNSDLSSRTEQQAAALEETAASMEQLTATVKQNADNARQASTLAKDASTTATRGGEVVDEVIDTMRGISTSSKEIADITGLIDSIAFQTNILALNASVEAARAGEQGRGFAVVAGEVRNLAGRSAEAARDIKALIDNSVQQVQKGSNLVEQAGSTMKDVVAAVKRVTDIMDEISAASQEQSGGIEQVSQAVSEMDKVTQQNAALVQEAAAAASSLEEQAQRLEQVVSVFRLITDSGRAPVTVDNEPEHPESDESAEYDSDHRGEYDDAADGQQDADSHKVVRLSDKPRHQPESSPSRPPAAKAAQGRNSRADEDDWEEF